LYNFLTICVSVVADFNALTFQFITKLYTKIQALNLALKPLLFLYIAPVAQEIINSLQI